jgi:hypothetical protein
LQPLPNVRAGLIEVHYAKDENQLQREEEIQAHWIGENQA